MIREARLDLLVLDCPPGFSSILERAVAAADLVLVPTGPGELDLAAVASIAAMAERAGMPFRFMLNRAVFLSRLAGSAVAALRERGHLLAAAVHQRVAIAAAMPGGRTALETEPGGPLVSRKGEARPPTKPAVRTRRPARGRRVGAALPTKLYVRFKAHGARHGITGEQAIVGAIEMLLGTG